MTTVPQELRANITTGELLKIIAHNNAVVGALTALLDRLAAMNEHDIHTWHEFEAACDAAARGIL